MDFANTLPELFMEVADPSSKRVLSSLFEHSMADRDKLCKFTVYHTVFM